MEAQKSVNGLAGVIIYLMPLGAGNSRDDSWHHWSTPLNSFWCCSGSIVESFGKLMDSIYFQRCALCHPCSHPTPRKSLPMSACEALHVRRLCVISAGSDGLHKV